MKHTNTYILVGAIAMFLFTVLACEMDLIEPYKQGFKYKQQADSIAASMVHEPNRNIQYLVDLGEYGVEYYYPVEGDFVQYEPVAGDWLLDTNFITFSARFGEMDFLNYNLPTGPSGGLAFEMGDENNEWIYTTLQGDIGTHIMRKMEPVSNEPLVVIYPYNMDSHALVSGHYPASLAQTAICEVFVQTYDPATDQFGFIPNHEIHWVDWEWNGGEDQLTPLIGQDTMVTVYGGELLQYREHIMDDEIFRYIRLSSLESGCVDSLYDEPAPYEIQMRQIKATVALTDGTQHVGYGWGQVRREDDNCVVDGSTEAYPVDWRGAYNNALGDDRSSNVELRERSLRHAENNFQNRYK